MSEGGEGAAGGPLVEITGIAGGGDGVGRLPDGRALFVPRAAPGDRVRVEVLRDAGRWARGRIVELVERSPARTEPPCPLYARCGGCQLQHLTYAAQLEAKARVVADALRRLGGRAVDPPPVHSSPDTFHYRNRMSYTLRRLRGGRLVAGLHEHERPARLLDVDGRCMLPEGPVIEAWAALREAWGPGARRLPPGGELRLTLRGTADGVVLVVEGGGTGGEPEALLEAVPGLVAVWHRPAGSPGIDARCVAGDADAVDVWEDERVPVRAGAFLQVNRGAAAALHEAVLDALGAPAGLHVVDAYAGVGLLGRRLARGGARVTAIELDPHAARAAAEGAPQGFRIVQGRVEDRLAAALPADRLIVNPPRTGLDARLPAILREHPVPRLVYVSCDPPTLARDLARLGEAFHIVRVEAFDLFPQTAHVETMVILDHDDAHRARAHPSAET